MSRGKRKTRDGGFIFGALIYNRLQGRLKGTGEVIEEGGKGLTEGVGAGESRGGPKRKGTGENGKKRNLINLPTKLETRGG